MAAKWDRETAEEISIQKIYSISQKQNKLDEMQTEKWASEGPGQLKRGKLGGRRMDVLM